MSVYVELYLSILLVIAMITFLWWSLKDYEGKGVL